MKEEWSFDESVNHPGGSKENYYAQQTGEFLCVGPRAVGFRTAVSHAAAVGGAAVTKASFTTSRVKWRLVHKRMNVLRNPCSCDCAEQI